MIQEETKTERVEAQNAEMDADSYIEALREMKENSVPKDDFLKLKAENRKLLNSLANGDYSSQKEEVKEELPTRIECLKKYRANNFSNDLEYWKNICDLRDATIREYGKDPTVTGAYGVTPEGDKLDPAYGEVEEMEAQFNTIKAIINEANGSPEQFKILLADAVR